jgi:hypothetical protein
MDDYLNRLDEAEKEALYDLARIMARDDNFDKMRALLRAQLKISGLVAARDHLAWVWSAVLKAGTLAGVVMACFGVYRAFFDK